MTEFVLAVTFDQFNASLLNKSLNFLEKNLTDPKLFNNIIYIYCLYTQCTVCNLLYYCLKNVQLRNVASHINFLYSAPYSI